MDRVSETTPRRWTFRLAVVLVVLAVVGVCAFGWWRLWGVGGQAARTAARAASDYTSGCNLDPGFNGGDAQSVAADVTVGLLTLPGSSTAWPIRAGVSGTALDAGVGWYQQTAAPGQVGNMAVVGQRLVSGGPFDNILGINTGDAITVKTCAATYTYTVVTAPRDLTVQPVDTWVLDAVPGSPGAMPTDAWLTLIANQDVAPTPDRAVGFAKLTATTPA